MSGQTTSSGLLSVQPLESREVPAYLSLGNLYIVGTDAADTVVVKDVRTGGAARIRVNHNGVVQNFYAANVPGQIVFFGYGGNDSFDYYGRKRVYAEGGDGDDFLSADRGRDLLIGGWGDDTIEGWAGGDELQGSGGNDRLNGGRGNDRLFGHEGDDDLVGMGGIDELIGGFGVDLAWGGAGADRFWECQEDTYLPVPVQTPFGVVSVGGVQDYSPDLGDAVYS
jgi:Ca2+-binding RTX toxin-like protein